MTKRQELEENMDEIKNMLTYMFKAVFVHRYRFETVSVTVKLDNTLKKELFATFCSYLTLCGQPSFYSSVANAYVDVEDCQLMKLTGLDYSLFF